MTALLSALLGYLLAVSLCGPRMVRAVRARARQAPRLGLLGLLALLASWVAAALSAGIAAVAHLADGVGFAALLHACARALQTLLDGQDPLAAVGVVGTALFVLRVAAVGAVRAAATYRLRSEHHRSTRDGAETRWCAGDRVRVLATDKALAYCTPGRGGAVMVTTGALHRLSGPQLDAVVAHERAHLRGRHHRYLAAADVLARAFPFVPLLRAAAAELGRLAEWAADDDAARRTGRRTVATALAVMATGAATPVGALPAAASDVPDRVRRLLHAGERGTRWWLTTAFVLPALAIGAAAILVLPALTADPTPWCSHTLR